MFTWYLIALIFKQIHLFSFSERARKNFNPYALSFEIPKVVTDMYACTEQFYDSIKLLKSDELQVCNYKSWCFFLSSLISTQLRFQIVAQNRLLNESRHLKSILQVFGFPWILNNKSWKQFFTPLNLLDWRFSNFLFFIIIST